MEKLHLEILDDKRQLIFEGLSKYKHLGYLAGGTALALQLGHRLSYDFDIFCPKEIPPNFSAKIKDEFDIRETILNNSDELTFLTKEDVKVSFIYYPFGLKEYILNDDGLPINLLSTLGIIATKAYALNRRSAWRDYLDIYFVLKNGFWNLETVIGTAQKIYGELFNEKLFLAQLVYTDDIPAKEIEETPLLKGQADLAEIKSFFQEEIEKYWNKGK